MESPGYLCPRRRNMDSCSVIFQQSLARQSLIAKHWNDIIFLAAHKDISSGNQIPEILYFGIDMEEPLCYQLSIQFDTQLLTWGYRWIQAWHREPGIIMVGRTLPGTIKNTCGFTANINIHIGVRCGSRRGNLHTKQRVAVFPYGLYFACLAFALTFTRTEADSNPWQTTTQWK